jgi:hypothetical protein
MLKQLALLTITTVACHSASAPPLRVCSDPNNLPFSNQRQEGFENRLAELIAQQMGTRVEYTWMPQWRGFLRNTLLAKKCDVVMGITSGAERVLTTAPYYRSTYVFVYRKDRNLAIRSLDDSALRKLKIGVQLVGDDYANTPPVHALSRRGIIDNLVGYSVFGDYSQAQPARPGHRRGDRQRRRPGHRVGAARRLFRPAFSGAARDRSGVARGGSAGASLRFRYLDGSAPGRRRAQEPHRSHSQAAAERRGSDSERVRGAAGGWVGG